MKEGEFKKILREMVQKKLSERYPTAGSEYNYGENYGQAIITLFGVDFTLYTPPRSELKYYAGRVRNASKQYAFKPGYVLGHIGDEGDWAWWPAKAVKQRG
jgi:hypothetical protein